MPLETKLIKKFFYINCCARRGTLDGTNNFSIAAVVGEISVTLIFLYDTLYLFIHIMLAYAETNTVIYDIIRYNIMNPVFTYYLLLRIISLYMFAISRGKISAQCTLCGWSKFSKGLCFCMGCNWG